MTFQETIRCASLVALVLFAWGPYASAEPSAYHRAKALQDSGKYEEAFTLFSDILEGRESASGEEVGLALREGVAALTNLNRIEGIDQFIETHIKRRNNDFSLLISAAEAYNSMPRHGYLVGGEFTRGWARGGGAQYVNTERRDRVRALQLYNAATRLPLDTVSHEKQSAAFLGFAATLHRVESWQLQLLSDLTRLPAWKEPESGGARGLGAPVTPEGSPVLYGVPVGFDAARNDGERWRWCLKRAGHVDPKRQDAAEMIFADWLVSQFGLGTLQFQPVNPLESSGEVSDRIVRGLTDSQFFARLANGTRQFELPDDSNFIRIYERLAKNSPGLKVESGRKLAAIFLTRGQRARAAGYLRVARQRANPTEAGEIDTVLRQITSEWVSFSQAKSGVPEEKGSLQVAFRNTQSISFEVFRVDHNQIFRDIEGYLARNPENLDWERVNWRGITEYFAEQTPSHYQKESVASWHVPTTPPVDHGDGVVSATIPSLKGGVYLVSARTPTGHESRVLLWINDTVIVKKPAKNGTYFYVADAKSGTPIPGATLSFLGYQQTYSRSGRLAVKVKNGEGRTNPSGIYFAPASELPSTYQWMTTLAAKSSRFAYLGFEGVWYSDPSVYSQGARIFGVTDRPVYRPKQQVKFKAWIKEAGYGDGMSRVHLPDLVPLTVTDPHGEVLFAKSFEPDPFGAFEGEVSLEVSAPLGQYSVNAGVWGQVASFRVEEYKKPEFEVSVDVPKEAVSLGQSFNASIKARYYFGAPVVAGTAHVKVVRTIARPTCFPRMPWDWLYGAGYHAQGEDYPWLKGYRNGGCGLFRRAGWYGWRDSAPGEDLVYDSKLPLKSDGTVSVPIDTSGLKGKYGEVDHLYSVTVDVVDGSNRVVSGSGSVQVTREPFSVSVWSERGFYSPGDPVRLEFAAILPSGGAVAGRAEISLYKLTYDSTGAAIETLAESWSTVLDSSGKGTQTLSAQRGQYRAVVAVLDERGRRVESKTVFSVFADKDGVPRSDYRFRALEVAVERAQYGEHETARVRISSDKEGLPALAFIRPLNGVYTEPKGIALTGRSQVVEIPLSDRDIPNIFVEVVAVQDGDVLSEVREILIPPVAKVIDVMIESDAAEYKPGDKATLTIYAKDSRGDSVSTGSFALTVYDKAVEYVSGGSNIPPILTHFWGGRRTHTSRHATNASLVENGLALKGVPRMENLISAYGSMPGWSLIAAYPSLGRGAATMKLSRMQDSEGMLGSSDEMPHEKSKLPMAAAPSDGSAPPAAAPASPPQSSTLVARSQFADTALWITEWSPAADGGMQATFTVPDDLTTWKIKSWMVGKDSAVGENSLEVVSKKELLIRPQHPRFLVERDEVVFSGVVHNYSAEQIEADVKLSFESKNVTLLTPAERKVSLAPGKEQVVEWGIRAEQEGELQYVMSVQSGKLSDGVRRTFPIEIRGALRTQSWSAALRDADRRVSIPFDVPTGSDPEQTKISVQVSPSLAVAMVDALPYLVEYPYGCSEQTLSRFLPTVITHETLKALKVDLSLVKKRIEAVLKNADAKHPLRAKQGVFDEGEVQRIAKAGIDRLKGMQSSDGGWGWFPGGLSTPHLTAHVTLGLLRAKRSGMNVSDSVLQRASTFLQQVEASSYQELTTTSGDRMKRDKSTELDVLVHYALGVLGNGNPLMRDLLWRDYLSFSLYSRALLGLALHGAGDEVKAKEMVTHLLQYLDRDTENQSAHLRLENGGYWWLWYGSENEAHAYFLRLLLKVDPKNTVASEVVKYLVNNRRGGTYWNSTRDTALVIEALGEYLAVSQEGREPITARVEVDGVLIKELRLTPENLFTGEGVVTVEGEAVKSGSHSVTVSKEGAAPLYVSVYGTYFSREDVIPPAGLELKAQRKYFLLQDEGPASVPVPGSLGEVLTEKREKLARRELRDGDLLSVGDTVEVELTVESKNDYEYILLTDKKPAGLEAIEVQSGYTGNELGAYVEYRDNRVALFIASLPRGTRMVTYRLRAERPGVFTALPAVIEGMYAPELVGNSASRTVGVKTP